MAEESFYGVTLKGKNSSVEWDVLSNDEDYPRGQKLIIKQILLGAEAKEDEFNVVEVQTVKDSLKIPIAVLKAGETRAVNPDVEFYDTSVTFKLIEGEGPVYIHGQNLKDDFEVVQMEEESEEEDDGEDEEVDAPKRKPKSEPGNEEEAPKKKLKMDNNTDANNKQNKKK